VGAQTRNISLRRVLIALLLIGFGAGIAVLMIELLRGSNVSLPAGCSPSDSLIPGCRPVSSSGASPLYVGLFAIPVTLVGAIGAAWIAADSASRRQIRALRAEAGRHAATLASERDLADREDLRAQLDQVMATLAEQPQLLLRTIGHLNDEDLKEDLRAHVLTLRTSVDRLRMRLGPPHEVPKALGVVVDELRKLSEMASARADHADALTAAHEQVSRLREVTDAFIEVSWRSVGVRFNAVDSSREVQPREDEVQPRDESPSPSSLQ
jgi:hypothetical protein